MEGFIHFHSLNRRSWRSISMRLFNKVTFTLQRPLLLRAFSLCPRRTETCSLVSITGASTKSQSSSVILFLSSQRHLNISTEPLFSPSWTSAAHITSSGYARGTSGRLSSLLPTGHYEYRVMPYGLVNAPSVFQDFMHEVLSRSISIDSTLSTLMTF